MKILTEEMALRDQTRSFHQAKAQLDKETAKTQTVELAGTQDDLANRTDDVIEQIRDLPDGDQNFGKEIKQLTNASFAMGDAFEYLDEGDTGPNAIAAETEAIEWLLRAKRMGGGGGGGGSDPGGGGNRRGEGWRGSALARLGGSQEKLSKVVKRDTKQATGKTGRELPEEYRSGLDVFLEKLESEDSAQ